jgi:hypothetical protein
VLLLLPRQHKKVVVLEDLGAEFGMKTQEVINRVRALEQLGRISGVFDDRGKFIYVSHPLPSGGPACTRCAPVAGPNSPSRHACAPLRPQVTVDEISKVAAFVNRRGRISLSALAAESNRMISLKPTEADSARDAAARAANAAAASTAQPAEPLITVEEAGRTKKKGSSS